VAHLLTCLAAAPRRLSLPLQQGYNVGA
jgi:hypothetical protein